MQISCRGRNWFYEGDWSQVTRVLIDRILGPILIALQRFCECILAWISVLERLPVALPRRHHCTLRQYCSGNWERSRGEPLLSWYIGTDLSYLPFNIAPVSLIQILKPISQLQIKGQIHQYVQLLCNTLAMQSYCKPSLTRRFTLA